MIKKLTAAALSAAMVFGSVGAFAASGFTDLNEFHAWAEPQIEEMTTLGIIKGYTDGSFRPDRAITKTEALVLVSRAAGFITEDYDTFKTAAYNRYADLVAKYNSPYPNEVSFLLYKGILTESDIAGYAAADRADSSLLRYEMAELLTKLMRAEGSLNDTSEISLTYSDAGEIPFVAAPYVDYVTNTSLMQGVYDPEYPDDIFFKPYASVTRAQMAVLLHRVLAKLETSVTYADFIGKNTQTNKFTYRDASGKTAFFSIDNSARLIIDGYVTKDISHAHTGAKIAFFSINDSLVDIEIVNTAENTWNGVEIEKEPIVIPTAPVEGVITTIVLSDECSVIVNDVEYTLSAASTIFVDHVAATMYDLRVGHTANLQFENGKIITIYATSPSQNTEGALTAEGVITKVSVTSRYVHLNVENVETGIVSEKKLFIETGAVIFNAISGQNIDFLSLDVDDEIIATGTLKNGEFHASKIIVK